MILEDLHPLGGKNVLNMCDLFEDDYKDYIIVFEFRWNEGWMDGWLGFNGILSTQVPAISCLNKLKVC